VSPTPTQSPHGGANPIGVDAFIHVASELTFILNSARLLSGTSRARVGATPYLPPFKLTAAVSPFTSTAVPNGREESASRSRI
jgi:hypothetical protein